MAKESQKENGKEAARPRSKKNRTRQKEQAEIDRIAKAVQAIPRYSNRYMLFRQNRRQKAKQQQATEDVPKQPQAEEQHPIFASTKFTDLPLSPRTLDGLAAADFSELTPIQRLSVPQALAGRDILAAAPTGSGKTLAFLIPMLEILWREKWNPMDGLGALILTPTRELSMQIFNVLRIVARQHMISAGLVIGGKAFDDERGKVGTMNVLVGTPGRVLHHMDEVADFNSSSLKVLVLDEADRILDMGFSKTLDAIMANMPATRQTLLFSATQTKDIKALARLSLKSPEYMMVSSSTPKTLGLTSKTTDDGKEEGEDDEDDGKTMTDKNGATDTANAVKIVGTPEGLSQSYAVVKLSDKLSVLWSFLRTHLQSKMIIFMASSKQVRFVFETFCKLRPGMSLLHLHGKMKQERRTEMYEAFCKSKSSALFATDVASRGLDFPDVEWVVQVDCPDDVGTYVHRVGRTARFRKNGRAMLLLTEGKEETFLKRLEAKKLTLQLSKINPSRMTSIEPKISAVVASNQALRVLAQRAFAFYVKSIYQRSDKEVFDISEMDFAAFAKSFGLTVTPKVAIKASKEKSVKTSESKLKTKTVFGYDARHSSKAQDEGSSDDDDKKTVKDSKKRKEKESKRKSNAEENDDTDEDDTGILTLKRTHAAEDNPEMDEESGEKLEPVKRKKKKRKLDLLKGMASVNRTVFDEDGKAVPARDVEVVGEDEAAEGDEHTGIEEYAASVSKRLEETAVEDKERERGRVRAKHAKRRQKEKELQKTVVPKASAGVAVLAPVSDSEMDVSDDDVDDGDDVESDDGEALGDNEKLALQILQARSQ